MNKFLTRLLIFLSILSAGSFSKVTAHNRHANVLTSFVQKSNKALVTKDSFGKHSKLDSFTKESRQGSSFFIVEELQETEDKHESDKALNANAYANVGFFYTAVTAEFLSQFNTSLHFSKLHLFLSPVKWFILFAVFRI